MVFVQLDKALEFLEKMKAEGFKPSRHTYNILIHHYAQKQVLTMTKEMYRDLKKYGLEKPSRGSIMPLLDLLARSGRVNEIMTYADDVKELKGVEDPFLLLYTVILQAYINTGQLAKALETFQYMKKKNIKPDENVYLLLINGCAKLKAHEEVTTLWDEMEELFPPSDKKYSALVEVYLAKDNANPLQAASLIQTVLDNHLNLEPRTWHSFLNFLVAREIQDEEAAQLSKQIEGKVHAKLSKKDVKKMQDFLVRVKKHIVRAWEGVDLIVSLNKELLPGV
jgi:pentatricopeptide repeat protein